MSSIPPVELQVKLLSPQGTIPTQGSVHSAGLDLYSAESKSIPARGKALVDLALSVAIPEGHYGRVAPRSGLASKHGIETGAGVIDSDYRGPVKVLLFNHSDVEFQINHKDRIAQLILERISIPSVRQVDTLDETVRGEGGFGSTGGFGVAPLGAEGVDGVAKKQKMENGDGEITKTASATDPLASNGA